jgi:hypothetical protein
VVAGHQGERGIARAALGDPDPSVRGAALGALERCAALGPDELSAGLADPDRSVRRRAALVAAHDLTQHRPVIAKFACGSWHMAMAQRLADGT